MNYQKFRVANNLDALVDVDQRASRCNRCGEKIYWGTSNKGMNMPLTKNDKAPGFRQHLYCSSKGGNIKTRTERFIEEERRNLELLNNL